MKKLFLILVAVIFLLLGYVLGNFLPLSFFGQEKSSLPQADEQGIQGNAQLEVILKTDTGMPLANIEVDVAEQPGPPPVGGLALTDENGVAIFNIKPGNYFIFFNDTNFPKDFENPPPQPVEVKADESDQTTIILNAK